VPYKPSFDPYHLTVGDNELLRGEFWCSTSINTILVWLPDGKWQEQLTDQNRNGSKFFDSMRTSLRNVALFQSGSGSLLGSWKDSPSLWYRGIFLSRQAAALLDGKRKELLEAARLVVNGKTCPKSMGLSVNTPNPVVNQCLSSLYQ
jgi:hypothetical protein